MTLAKRPEEFPWYIHQVQFDPSAVTNIKETFRLKKDEISQAYPHPLVVSRCLAEE